MLSDKELKQIKEELDSCKAPVFLYDNDADGLCSYLLFYKYKGEGKGYRHQKNIADDIEAENIKRMAPDKIFILDVPAGKLTQDFIDSLGVPVVHVEHHILTKKLKGIKTFNPTIKDEKDDPATAAICYNVVKENLWLAALGSVSDWRLGKETEEFAKKNPDLLDPEITDPSKALFETKLGLLGKIFNFILKGKSGDVRRTINSLHKIKYPYDILEQNTEEGKKIYKRFEQVNRVYQNIYNTAIKNIKDDKLVVFMYEEEDLSFSAELSNELLHKYPNKIILVARRKKGEIDSEVRCSVRGGKTEIRTKFLKAMKGVDGTGGGHAGACGALIKAHSFDKFLKQLREQL